MINKQFPNSLKLLTGVTVWNDNKDDVELKEYIISLSGFQTNMDLAKEQLDYLIKFHLFKSRIIIYNLLI